MKQILHFSTKVNVELGAELNGVCKFGSTGIDWELIVEQKESNIVFEINVPNQTRFDVDLEVFDEDLDDYKVIMENVEVKNCKVNIMPNSIIENPFNITPISLEEANGKQTLIFEVGEDE